MEKVLSSAVVKAALLTIALASVVAGLSAIKNGMLDASAKEGAEAVIATVEGKPISARLYRMYLRNGIDELGLSEESAEGRSRLELLKEGIVSELVDRALIEAEARRRGMTIPQEVFDAAIKRRMAELGGERGYQSYLSEHGLSEEEFRQVVTQELYGQLVAEELSREVVVTRQEVSDYYEREKKNPGSADIFIEPERVRASHILISARRSRAAAAQILNRVKAGEDFASLARRYSDDPGTKLRGGDLGLFTRTAHTARFDEAAFKLKPGEVSGLVETEYGLHIIKVSERKAERARTLDEVAGTIEQTLLSRKRAEHLTRWLELRRQEADIRVEPQYRFVSSK